MEDKFAVEKPALNPANIDSLKVLNVCLVCNSPNDSHVLVWSI